MKVTLSITGQTGATEIDDDYREELLIRSAGDTAHEQLTHLIGKVVSRASGAHKLDVTLVTTSTLEKLAFLQGRDGEQELDDRTQQEVWNAHLGGRISMITQELEELGYHMVVDSLGEGREEQIQWHGFGRPYSVDMIQELENVSSRRNEALNAIYDMLAERGFGVNMQVPADIDEPIVATWSDDRAPAHSQDGWTTSASPSELARLRQVEAQHKALTADIKARGFDHAYGVGCDGAPVVHYETLPPGADTVQGLRERIRHTEEQRDSLIKAVTDKGWEFDYERAHGKIYVDWHSNCVPPTKRQFDAGREGRQNAGLVIDKQRAQLEACKATLQALGFGSELVYNEPRGCWECIVDGTLHVAPSEEYTEALNAVLRAVDAVVSAHTTDGPAPEATIKQRGHLARHWQPLDHALRDLRVLHAKLVKVGSGA